MLSVTHIAYIAIVVVLVQSINIRAASDPTNAVDSSVAAASSAAESTPTDKKIEELEAQLLIAEEKNRKLMDTFYQMRSKKLALDLECYQLSSDNISLREQLDYQKSIPCPWDVIAGNITGTAVDKLNNICDAISPVEDRNPSKKDKHYSGKRNSMVLREKPLAPDDPALAIALTDVAFALQASERYEEAEPLFAWALMIIYTDRAGNHLPTATALKNLANLYLDLNAYAKAESAYRRSLAEYRYVFDDEHPKFASIHNVLAASLRGQKRYNEAEEMYLKSIAIYKSAFGSDHLRLVAPIHNLAQLYIEMSRYKDAAIWLQQAMAIVKENKATKTYLVHLEETQRRLDQAMSVHEQNVSKIDQTEMEVAPL